MSAKKLLTKYVSSAKLLGAVVLVAFGLSSCLGGGTVKGVTPALFVFDVPIDITISDSNAYIVNAGKYIGVIKCSYASATGALTSCVNANVSGLNMPLDITISDSNAYIVSIGNTSVTKCSYASATGDLSNCGKTGYAP